MFGRSHLLPDAEPDLCHTEGREHLCKALFGILAALDLAGLLGLGFRLRNRLIGESSGFKKRVSQATITTQTSTFTTSKTLPLNAYYKAIWVVVKIIVP